MATDTVNLTDEQLAILQLSDKGIETGNLISQDELDKNDLEWLQENSLKSKKNRQAIKTDRPSNL